MTKVMIKDSYRGFSHGEVLDKAYELGSTYLEDCESCSQATVAALRELLDIDEVIEKVAISLGGGTAEQTLGTCGTIAGGIMVLDYYLRPLAVKTSYEKPPEADLDASSSAIQAAKLLANKFVKEYGTFICAHIQRQLFGRSFCFEDPDDAEKFEKAGGDSDPTKCRHIVGNAARWVLEILLDKGCVEL